MNQVLSTMRGTDPVQRETFLAAADIEWSKLLTLARTTFDEKRAKMEPRDLAYESARAAFQDQVAVAGIVHALLTRVPNGYYAPIQFEERLIPDVQSTLREVAGDRALAIVGSNQNAYAISFDEITPNAWTQKMQALQENHFEKLPHLDEPQRERFSLRKLIDLGVQNMDDAEAYINRTLLDPPQPNLDTILKLPEPPFRMPEKSGMAIGIDVRLHERLTESLANLGRDKGYDVVHKQQREAALAR